MKHDWSEGGIPLLRRKSRVLKHDWSKRRRGKTQRCSVVSWKMAMSSGADDFEEINVFACSFCTPPIDDNMAEKLKVVQE